VLAVNLRPLANLISSDPLLNKFAKKSARNFAKEFATRNRFV
jgi:hypothetical protein